MHRRLRALPLVFLVALAGWLATPLAAPVVPADDPSTQLRVVPSLSRDEGAIEHALTRLTFGPRPGDVEQVRRIGLAAWIERQLNPSRIDDSALNARLASFTTLSLDSLEIARQYFLPARQARRERQRAQSSDPGSRIPDPGSMTDRGTRTDERRDRQILVELSSAKLLRAVSSERQLEEVLVDFWFNHFNVFAGKGRTGMYVTEYEREAIRPHVLGRFRDLLGATAKSPAMLFYLDNWMSAGAGTEQVGATHASPLQPVQRRPRGLNENYGRELLELHTLGVDGGYAQKDVVDVARAFTGWTIDPRQQRFRFAPAMHDREAKIVLGQQITAGGGIEDGERVLDILAAHPATAAHIARKLAQRFVSDTPPPALIERAAARFLATRGDLREVVRTIVTSPEFFAPAYRRTKVKTPLEFVASAIRSTGTAVSNTRPLLRALQQLGMPLYLCQPPTGYADTADAWVSSGGLVTRMNLAQSLSADRAVALRLGSPEFQRR